MCATSMIYDSAKTSNPWDNFQTKQPLPDLQAIEAIKRFLELIDAAKRYDTATSQPNCEDPKKAAFEVEVLNRLAALEKKIGAKS